MTEQPIVGNAPATGAEGTPNPAVSPQGTQPIEGADQLLSALRGEFKNQFEGLTKEIRGLQSRQDKSENRFAEQLARLDSYQGQGLSREQALAKMNAEDADVNWRQSLESKLDSLTAQLASVGTQANGQQKVAEVFATVGLDPKDPRVAPFLVKEYKTPEAMELAAFRLKDELSKSPNPTPAQSATLQGSPQSSTQDALMAAYREEVAKYRGQPIKISEVQAEFRKRGLEIW